MKITIFAPKKEFTNDQVKTLASFGKVLYTKDRNEYPVDQLIKLARGSEIIGLDPDNFGGFDIAKDRVTQLMETLPNLKGIALSSSYAEWVDLEYFRKRKIPVTNVPFFCTESVAEDTIALLICLAKKIILSDRRTQQNRFQLEMGFELKGKTLGILGLGHIGLRVARLATALGMKVIAWSRTPKHEAGIEMKSLNSVLKESDAISIHLGFNKNTKHLLTGEKIKKIKKGAIIVDTTLVGREITDEKAMAKALMQKKISAYAYETENTKSGPLAKVENAIGLLGFGWYTKDSIEREMKTWTDSMISLINNKPQNRVV